MLLDGIPEVAGLTLMHRIADLLVEEGLASPEGGDVRAVIGMHPHTWTPDLAAALHVDRAEGGPAVARPGRELQPELAASTIATCGRTLACAAIAAAGREAMSCLSAARAARASPSPSSAGAGAICPRPLTSAVSPGLAFSAAADSCLADDLRA